MPLKLLFGDAFLFCRPEVTASLLCKLLLQSSHLLFGRFDLVKLSAMLSTIGTFQPLTLRRDVSLVFLYESVRGT